MIILWSTRDGDESVHAGLGMVSILCKNMIGTSIGSLRCGGVRLVAW